MRSISPELQSVHAILALRQRAELLLLSGLLACYLFVYLIDLRDYFPFFNVAGPVMLTAIMAWSTYRMASSNPLTIWAPLFWFRIACATYYGFGALVPHIVNSMTLMRIYGVYYFTPQQNLKVNIIYTLGILCTLTFSYFFLSPEFARRKRVQPVAFRSEHPPTLKFAVAFLLFGGLLRYGVVLPYSFGLSGIELPGMFIVLARFYYVGIYLLIVQAIGPRGRFLYVAVMLVTIEAVVSIASFSKTDLLLVLISSLLAFFSHGVRPSRVIFGASLIFFAYFWFQPLVEYGRQTMSIRYGKIEGADISERLDIVGNYFQTGSDLNHPLEIQSGLSRLSYVNVDAFVVDRFDAGNPGKTLQNAFAVFIPRILWSNKPIISDIGKDLNILVSGSDTSSMGVGHFAEAYWDFGWIGIAPFMAVLSLILSLFSRVSIAIMSRKDWLFLPLVFLGVNMGIRADGHFVTDVLGPSWMAFVLGLSLFVIKSLALTQRERKRRYHLPVSRTGL